MAANDPTVCSQCGQPIRDGQKTAAVHVELVEKPNDEFRFETLEVEGRRHVNCP